MQENDKRLRVRKALRIDVKCLIKVNLINFLDVLHSSWTAGTVVVAELLHHLENRYAADEKRKAELVNV